MEFVLSVNQLSIRTPGQFAMGVAISSLRFLDSKEDTFVKHTGWQNGFGLEVAVWLPIVKTSKNQVEILTDGEGFWLRRISGPRGAFADLMNSIRFHLHEIDT